MYDYGGGGGWGDPLDRDPQAVLDDVLDEYVSVEGASRDYGVVLTGSLDDLTLAVDDEPRPTQLARRRCRVDRPEHGLPGRGRRRRHVHRPHLRHARRARSCSTRRRPRSTTSRRRDERPRRSSPSASGSRLGELLRAARHPRARHHHRRQHDDRDERRAHRACSSPKATATRSSCAACHKEEIWDPSYPAPDPDRPPAGPHPDPRAHATSRATSLLAARRGRGARAACSG